MRTEFAFVRFKTAVAAETAIKACEGGEVMVSALDIANDVSTGLATTAETLTDALTYSTTEFARTFSTVLGITATTTVDTASEFTRGGLEIFEMSYQGADKALRTLGGGGKDFIEGSSDMMMNVGDNLVGKPFKGLNTEFSKFTTNFVILSVTVGVLYIGFKLA